MMNLIISCEHGGNKIPKAYQSLFLQAQVRLQSHEGWDIGALALARLFAKKIPAIYFFYADISRLLIDLNRSLHHPKLFSDVTKPLGEKTKNLILEHYYFAYRDEVTGSIETLINKKQKVLHISVHSFVPVLNDHVRVNAVGLLYDPARSLEKEFCVMWRDKLLAASTAYKIRFNYPYFGKADGLVTSLRKQFCASDYIGIELEVNQHYLADKKLAPHLQHLLCFSLRSVILSV